MDQVIRIGRGSHHLLIHAGASDVYHLPGFGQHILRMVGRSGPPSDAFVTHDAVSRRPVCPAGQSAPWKQSGVFRQIDFSLPGALCPDASRKSTLHLWLYVFSFDSF